MYSDDSTAPLALNSAGREWQLRSAASLESKGAVDNAMRQYWSQFDGPATERLTQILKDSPNGSYYIRAGPANDVTEIVARTPDGPFRFAIKQLAPKRFALLNGPDSMMQMYETWPKAAYALVQALRLQPIDTRGTERFSNIPLTLPDYKAAVKQLGAQMSAQQRQQQQQRGAAHSNWVQQIRQQQRGTGGGGAAEWSDDFRRRAQQFNNSARDNLEQWGDKAQQWGEKQQQRFQEFGQQVKQDSQQFGQQVRNLFDRGSLDGTPQQAPVMQQQAPLPQRAVPQQVVEPQQLVTQPDVSSQAVAPQSPQPILTAAQSPSQPFIPQPTSSSVPLAQPNNTQQASFLPSLTQSSQSVPQQAIPQQPIPQQPIPQQAIPSPVQQQQQQVLQQAAEQLSAPLAQPVPPSIMQSLAPQSAPQALPSAQPLQQPVPFQQFSRGPQPIFL